MAQLKALADLPENLDLTLLPGDPTLSDIHTGKITMNIKFKKGI